eukprot:m.226878 g.226878  ORF g.226878 m.226878 type:complete len:134 (-) comp11497_c0_seq1:178-579(-)
MVQQFQCFQNLTTTPCNPQLRLQMSKFLYCFEGQKISEGHCDADVKNCTDFAGLTQYYDAITTCVSDPTQMAKAASAMDKACAARKPDSWPTVVVNNQLLCEDDSCFIPLLPPLCLAYKGTPKPKSCQTLGYF